MDYICVKTKTIEGIDGQFKLKKGNHVQRIGDYLFKDGKRICVWRSQTAKELFFLNDDGKGLEKSEKLQAIKDKIGEVLTEQERLYQSVKVDNLDEEAIKDIYEHMDDPFREKLNALAELPCFATFDAPYQATLEQLEEAYALLA